jgi:phosphoribosylaminoimidazole-succinocarboxamide synthase
MATLSPARAGWSLVPGLKLLSRGKVRDTNELPGCLLSSATDGISVFDFVLNALVPMKGVILNCMNHFWHEHLRQFRIPTHLLAVGAGIDEFLPAHLQGNADLQSRASVIRRMRMAPVEFIYRSVLTGSSVSSYRKDGAVCGHQLPPDLQDGDSLPCILDTPTTKAEEGHDLNMSFREVREQYPKQTMLGLQIFQICSNYCESRGIKLADTKFEFGDIVGDEIVTPDSSRFWEFKVWQDGRKLETRKAPPPYDKQLVRAWGIEQGINKRNPENPDDVTWVHSLEVPKKLIEQTTRIYRYIFWRLTGMTIERYLRERMGVSVSRKVPSIQVICGSDSDLPAIKPVLLEFTREHAEISASVMSCHRNPVHVMKFAEASCADVIICVGGKAFALPGVLDAFSHYYENDIPVIGVALGEPGSKPLLAAQLSIEEVPGMPVVMDEINGVYTGPQGLRSAINRVISGELPPPKPRTAKPVQINVFKNY